MLVDIKKGKRRKEKNKEKGWNGSLLSFCFLFVGGILLIYSLRFQFFVSPSLGALTPTTNFLLPVYICFLAFVFYGLSYWSKHTHAWQAWSCILLCILLLSFCFPFLLPRSSSYITDSLLFRDFVRFYPDPWGGITFQIQVGIWWFLAGTLLFTGGTVYNLSKTSIKKIKKASKTQGILAAGILVQEVSFFMFYNNCTYFGSVTYSFTLQRSQSWLALLAFPLFVYASCENNRRIQGYGLAFSSLFALTGYIFSLRVIPEIFPVAFSGVYVYTVSTCLLWMSFFLHSVSKRKPLQQIIVAHSDDILSVYLFTVFLFNTTVPFGLIVSLYDCVLARGLRYLFFPPVFLVILCLIAIGESVSMKEIRFPFSTKIVIESLFPWLGMAFLSVLSLQRFFSITKRSPYFLLRLNSIGGPFSSVCIPILIFLLMFVIEKMIVFLAYKGTRKEKKNSVTQ